MAEGTTPTAEPTALPFVVENVTFNNTPLGGLWCFGEVHNTTGTDLEQAGVTVSLLDEDGAVLAQTQDFVQFELIRPGGRAPFALRFPAPPASFASYLAAPWKGVKGYLGSYYLDLTAQDTRAPASATPPTRFPASSPTPARKTRWRWTSP